MNNPEPIIPEYLREEYAAFKAAQKERREQEECPHDEHDHGICLDCGKDIMDDLIGRSELMRDE